MLKYKFLRDGFIGNWLTTELFVREYDAPELAGTKHNQILYEQELRKVYYKSDMQPPKKKAVIGELSELGTKWKYYYNRGNAFLDFSSFYSTLSEIKFMAETIIVSDLAKNASAVLWTYANVEVWVNGKLVTLSETPVYKPIKKQVFNIPLQQGKNIVTLKVNNLGVRDTRNMVAIQLSDTNGLNIALDNDEAMRFADSAQQWLNGLSCKNSTLYQSCEADFDCYIHYNNNMVKITKPETLLPSEVAEFVVTAEKGDEKYQKHFEMLENVKPLRSTIGSDSGIENTCRILADIKYEERGPEIQISCFNVLARYYFGLNTAEDEELLLNDLDFISKRIDCADFIITAFVRLSKLYELSPKVKEKLKKTMLDFRFWMDEKGSDGMCFWSENHALLFYSGQMFMGEMFPDDLFVCSDLTGREKYEQGYKRCKEWLDQVEKDGMDEFNSTTYMVVTTAALLNIVDFGSEELSKQATRVINRIVKQFTMHIFDETVISPQCRIYRDVIHPVYQGAQVLINIFFPDMPYGIGEMSWFSIYLKTKYHFPDNLKEIANQDYSTSYTSANTKIVLEKTKNYILSSCQSPREKHDTPNWNNICFDEGVDTGTNLYVRSINECFHGTTVLEPGIYGYQQHMWYAALSNQCVVFANHPGSFIDMDEMRPGYWYGNLLLPAVKQEKNCLLVSYNLTENVPIRFTHVFWPTTKFDDVEIKDNWLFGRCKEGYIAVWCSGRLIKHDDVLTDCEYRCYDTDVSYMCKVSSAMDADFKSFIAHCEQNPPVKNIAAKTTRYECLELVHTDNYNKTQVV